MISYLHSKIRILLSIISFEKNCSLSEPSAPPTLVQGYNTSSTSIFVSWGVVSELDQNGVILSYTVTYEALPPSPALKVAKTVSAPNTSTTLEDLNEFTDYNITVFASTVKGGGNVSAPITVRTDEDSKYTSSNCAANKIINVSYLIFENYFSGSFNFELPLIQIINGRDDSCSDGGNFYQLRREPLKRKRAL